MKNTTICIASMLGGVIIGSALAMLFTPQSGPELRHKIKDLIDDEVEKLKSKAAQAHDQLKVEIEQARCKCDQEQSAQ